MYEVVIIGGGLMGCSAAWQVAREGKKVLLIEKQGSVYKNGSSYGEARVTRSLGVKDDIFTYLRELSVDETKYLLELLNEGEERQHSMTDIYMESPVTYIYDLDSINEVNALQMDDHYQIAHGEKELSEKFGVKLKNQIMIREFKPNAGTFNPKELIRKLKLGIEKLGGTIQHEHIVESIYPQEGLVKLNIEGAAESIQAKKLIVAAGPYSGKLLKPVYPRLDELLNIKRLFLTFFRLKKDYWESLSLDKQKRLKSFYPEAHMNGDIFYSMIEKMDQGVPIIKVGGHCRRFPIKHTNDIWKDEIPSSEIEWSLERTVAYLNAIGFNVRKTDLDYEQGYACVYTLTLSEVPIVSPLSDSGDLNNVVVIAGLSGVGAKGALAYGKIAADYILGNVNEESLHKKTVNALRLKTH